MKNKLIKLTKAQTNELLTIITKEEEKYGLCLLLQYIYGRNISEIYHLTKTDINKQEETITFTITDKKTITYPIHKQVKYLLYKLIDDENTPHHIFQIGKRPLHGIKDGINYYLHRKSDALNKLPYLHGIKLTSKDFKILRGQHLFQDGIELKTIHKLYGNTNINSTKRTINYEALYKEYYTTDVIKIIHDTNVTIYPEHGFNTNPVFYVKDEKENRTVILEVLNKEEFKQNGEETLMQEIDDMNPKKLIKNISQVENIGEYTNYKGLKFLRT